MRRRSLEFEARLKFDPIFQLGLAFLVLLRCWSADPTPVQVLASCDEASLRTALAAGGIIQFACDGTITLEAELVVAKNTILDASGHDVALSGGRKTRVLQVNSGVELSLIQLTIKQGKSSRGAGLFNDGGAI